MAHDAQPADATSSVEVAGLDVDGVNAVAIGTVVWAVALVVTLVMHSSLLESGNAWITWVCVSGLVLGLMGLPYVIRRRAVYRSAAASSPSAVSATTSTSTSTTSASASTGDDVGSSDS
ncbi:MAG: DUF2530 domain-containing protein [Actinomycetes bacterium]